MECLLLNLARSLVLSSPIAIKDDGLPALRMRRCKSFRRVLLSQELPPNFSRLCCREKVDALSDGIRNLAMHFSSTEAVKRKEIQSHVWKVPRA